MPDSALGSPASPIRRFFARLVQWFDSDHIPEGREKLWAEQDKVDWLRCLPFIVLHGTCFEIGRAHV